MSPNKPLFLQYTAGPYVGLFDSEGMLCGILFWYPDMREERLIYSLIEISIYSAIYHIVYIYT